MNDMKMKKQLMRLLGCAAFVLVLLCIGTVLLCIGTKTIRLHTYKYDSLLFQKVEALSSVKGKSIGKLCMSKIAMI